MNVNLGLLKAVDFVFDVNIVDVFDIVVVVNAVIVVLLVVIGQIVFSYGQ